MNEGITYGISQNIVMLHKDFQEFANIETKNSSEINFHLKNMQELLVQILVNQKKDSNLNLEKKRESSPMSNKSGNSGRSTDSKSDSVHSYNSNASSSSSRSNDFYDYNRPNVSNNFKRSSASQYSEIKQSNNNDSSGSSRSFANKNDRLGSSRSIASNNIDSSGSSRSIASNYNDRPGSSRSIASNYNDRSDSNRSIINNNYRSANNNYRNLKQGLDENHFVHNERDLYLYEFKQKFHKLFNKIIPKSHQLETIRTIEKDCTNEIARIKGIIYFLKII